MRPEPGQDIRKAHVSKPRDADVEPLSTIAADKPEQHAKHFAFTSDDRALVDLVLASDLAPDAEASVSED